MKRPYVICHILSSLDGKINGPFMGTEGSGRAESGVRYSAKPDERGCLAVRNNYHKRIYGIRPVGIGGEAHVIEILTEQTSAPYKAYLRKQGVSYILAGKKELDCRLAMEKLHELFHIEKVLICGGGMVNWSFLQAGVIDELSLVLAPVTDGSRRSASMFTRCLLREKEVL